jgi:hypothetical protein
MNDPAATIRDITRAIEHLATIRVRQQQGTRTTAGMVAAVDLDLEAQQVRDEIVSLAERLSVPVAAEKESLAYAAM